MITIELLRKVKVVYVHGHCPDGLASAMILKDAFRMLGMEPPIEFLVHNTREHKAAALDVVAGCTLFCDIAPHPEAAKVLHDTQTESRVIVLDHHKGAEGLVKSFAHHVFADEKAEPGVSGAVLAYREVWCAASDATIALAAEAFQRDMQRTRVEDFARATGARDTWQKDSPLFEEGQQIARMLMSKPQEYWLHEHAPYLHPEEVTTGGHLLEAHMTAVNQAVEQCAWLWASKFQPAAPQEMVMLHVFQEQASGFRLTSDVAEAIRQRGYNDEAQGVVAGFAWVVDKMGQPPRLLYSLRGEGFDVDAFARVNGGNGHTLAAGFSVDLKDVDDNPYNLVHARLIAYLEGFGGVRTNTPEEAPEATEMYLSSVRKAERRQRAALEDVRRRVAEVLTPE